jgi:hypothetical protein
MKMLDPDQIFLMKMLDPDQHKMQMYLPSTLGVYCSPGSKIFMKMLDPDLYKMKTYRTLVQYLQAWCLLQAVLKISEVNAAVSPGKIPFSNALQIDFLKVSKKSYFKKNDGDRITILFFSLNNLDE